MKVSSVIQVFVDSLIQSPTPDKNLVMSADPMTGYDLEKISTEIFLAMMMNPAWYQRAVSNGTADLDGIIGQLTTYAIEAAIAFKAQLKVTPGI